MGHLGVPRAFGTGGVPHFAAEWHCTISARFVDGLEPQTDAVEKLTTPDYPFSLEIPPLFAIVCYDLRRIATFAI